MNINRRIDAIHQLTYQSVPGGVASKIRDHCFILRQDIQTAQEHIDEAAKIMAELENQMEEHRPKGPEFL